MSTSASTKVHSESQADVAVASILSADSLPTAVEYRRDRLTWLSYCLYGFWSFAWGLFSPLMPFLRAELKLNYSTAALHFSALALGLLIAGLSGSRILAKV